MILDQAGCEEASQFPQPCWYLTLKSVGVVSCVGLPVLLLQDTPLPSQVPQLTTRSSGWGTWLPITPSLLPWLLRPFLPSCPLLIVSMSTRRSKKMHFWPVIWAAGSLANLDFFLFPGTIQIWRLQLICKSRTHHHWFRQNCGSIKENTFFTQEDILSLCLTRMTYIYKYECL